MKKITLNPDAEVVKTVKEGLKRTGGYCPCRLERTEENKCMCKEFRDQINDPDFEGLAKDVEKKKGTVSLNPDIIKFEELNK